MEEAGEEPEDSCAFKTFRTDNRVGLGKVVKFGLVLSCG